MYSEAKMQNIVPHEKYYNDGERKESYLEMSMVHVFLHHTEVLLTMTKRLWPYV